MVGEGEALLKRDRGKELDGQVDGDGGVLLGRLEDCCELGEEDGKKRRDV